MSEVSQIRSIGLHRSGSNAVAPAADTIFALSSGRLPAAIAVVRVSGPRAEAAAVALADRLPEPRRAVLRTLRDPVSREAIDQALLLWFPGPDSETGEDVVEFQVHGGSAVLAALLRSLGGLPGLRMAEAGEFTRRALDNEKLDLTQVEGLADLVSAATEAQRRQALGQLQGRLGNKAEGWRRRLIDAMALVEAGLDFADDSDVPQSAADQARTIIGELREEISAALADGHRGERLREGLVVAIAGPPNAGKSSLLNRLARREAALVSPIAGTTRDIIEVHLDLGGYPVMLLDTAGLRPTEDPLEALGVSRALERAAAADLVLWVEDATAPEQAPPLLPAGASLWRVTNKADLIDSVSIQHVPDTGDGAQQNRFEVSAIHGRGVDALVESLAAHAGSLVSLGEPALITRARHRAALTDVAHALDRALALPASSLEELFAEELRTAAVGIGRLLGVIDVDDVLDVVFRDFCIGK